VLFKLLTKDFFGAVDIIADRLPELNHLVIELVLIGVEIAGAYSLFRRHRWLSGIFVPHF